MDYFGARYYSAALVRFNSADSPFADQHSDDPQRWNLYTYVRNSPTLNIDTDGRGALKAVKLLYKDAKAAYEGGSFAAGVMEDVGTVSRAFSKGQVELIILMQGKR